MKKPPLFQTVDFFTPDRDDPFQFATDLPWSTPERCHMHGRKPLDSDESRAFPIKTVSPAILRDPARGPVQIEGGATWPWWRATLWMTRSQVRSVGNRLIHPRRILSNATARPGDSVGPDQAFGDQGLSRRPLKGGMASDAAVNE